MNGKTYQNVIVGQIEADCVHIQYASGIGRIAIADMPPELQARFKYDPAAAKSASDIKAKAQADAEAYLASLPKPVVIVTPAPVPPVAIAAKPSVNIAQIQADIAYLQADIAEKQRIQRGGDIGSGFRDVIAQDRADIDRLKAQLH